MNARERVFANLLTKQRRQWTYTKVRRFRLGKTTYRPDFYLPKENLYIEVVGSRQAHSANRYKYEAMKKLYPKVKFQVLHYTGNPYPSGRHFIGTCNPKTCLTCIRLRAEGIKVI